MQIFFCIIVQKPCNELKDNITLNGKKVFNNAVWWVIFGFRHSKYAKFYNTQTIKYSKKQYKILKQWKITLQHKEGD